MIRCYNLTAKYGENTILNNINFKAMAGETIAIIGPNGSGKTTLLNCISGIFSKYSGEIFFEENEIRKLTSQKRAQKIAVVPQRINYLPKICVKDLVLLGRYPYLPWFGLYSEQDHKIVKNVLISTNVIHLENHCIDQLSGGQLQRVLLARALAQETQVLLLDELSAGLDILHMKELFDLLENYRRKGACIITVMHDLNLAAMYATRLMGLKQGQILFDGKVNNVFTAKCLNKLYETKLHVFTHPECNIPQTCPSAGAHLVSNSLPKQSLCQNNNKR